MFFNGLLALGLRILLVWENHKLDNKYGPKDKARGARADARERAAGEENEGPAFRYIL
jgi:hypothetical protein